MSKEMFQALRARFEPILSLALQACQTSAGQQKSWKEIASDLERSVERELSLPTQPLLAEHVQLCRLACYTFVDELLLADHSPSRGGSWFTHSLQLTRLHTSAGGELFYQELARLVDSLTNAQALSSPQKYDVNTELANKVALLEAENGQTQSQSALATCAFFALCLLYGFRGQLYAPTSAPLLEQFLQAASRLVQRIDPWQNEQVLLTARQYDTAPKKRFWEKIPKPGPLVLLTTPLLLSVLWYLFCVNLAGSLSLP